MRWTTLSLFGAGFFGMLLLCEAALQMLPVISPPLSEESFDPEFPVYRWRQGEPFVYSRGVYLERPRSHYPNSMGMLNGGKMAPDFTLWIHGDSYIEAVMLDFDNSLQGNLTALAKGDFAVASVNSSGATLADYLTGIRLGEKTSRRSAHIVLVSAGDLAESFVPLSAVPPARSVLRIASDSTRIHLQHAKRTISASPLGKRNIWKMAKRSALFRYLYMNIQFQPTSLLKSGAPSAHPASSPATGVPDYYPKGVADFLDSVRSASSRVLFLMDCDRTALTQALLDGKKVLSPPRRDTLSVIFENIALSRNIPVYDLCPVFSGWMSRNRRALDFRPADSHWNEDAQVLAASVAFSIISEKKWLPAPSR